MAPIHGRRVIRRAATTPQNSTLRTILGLTTISRVSDQWPLLSIYIVIAFELVPLAEQFSPLRKCARRPFFRPQLSRHFVASGRPTASRMSGKSRASHGVDQVDIKMNAVRWLGRIIIRLRQKETFTCLSKVFGRSTSFLAMVVIGARKFIRKTPQAPTRSQYDQR